MNTNQEIIIIGGGLAGLTAGIHLSKMGISVCIIEKNDFPRHKVCGEYVSNEILPYFTWLGLNIEDLNPTKITELEFSTLNGKTIKQQLPLGGFGISRYEFDLYLYKKALDYGCKILKDSVDEINFENDSFTVSTATKKNLKAKIVIGAFGKRSTLDIKLNRNFFKHKSPWLAVKAHYSGNFPDNLVGLHNFNGGYCGVSKVENNQINICYLANYETFKNHKSIEEYQKNVVQQNKNLKLIFEQSTLLFEKPLTISQISFKHKKAVENHILMIGDTAGLIHPLCGNGMAIAIHSAKIASELAIQFLNNTLSRVDLEKKYITEWNFNFKNRLRTGRILSSILLRPKLSEALLNIAIRFPFVLSLIISKTHGKPIKINESC
jgi:hypothetical protein